MGHLNWMACCSDETNATFLLAATVLTGLLRVR
jgi:hypothetical protein